LRYVEVIILDAGDRQVVVPLQKPVADSNAPIDACGDELGECVAMGPPCPPEDVVADSAGFGGVSKVKGVLDFRFTYRGPVYFRWGSVDYVRVGDSWEVRRGW